MYNVSTPFFVLGNPRSGTSLLRLMLNNHPELAIPPECGFSEWLYEKYNFSEMSASTYTKFLEDVFISRKFETWQLNFDVLLAAINRKKPNNYRELVYEVYRSYARGAGKPMALLGDKNNYYMKKIDKLEAIFPACKKVFIVRDGRDVACSYLAINEKKIASTYKPQLAGDIAEIAKEWVSSVEIMNLWLTRGAISVRYEDLVESPHENLSEICKFLGLSYSEKMLSYYKNNDEPEEFMAWKGRTLAPIDTTSIERYKTELTVSDLESFESIASDSLQLAGYHV